MSRVEFNWWESPDGEVHTKVIAYAKYLKSTQAYYYREMKRYGYMYSEKPYYIYGGDRYSQDVGNTRLSVNASASAIDTLHSKITQNTPKNMFVTNNADFVQQQKAKNLTDFIDGELYRSSFKKKCSEMAHDAFVYGTGILQAYFDKTKEKIEFERILPYDFMVDLAEATYRHPRQVHKLKVVNRTSLADKFKDDPVKVKKILQSPVDTDLIRAPTRTEELVLVVESWYLASKEGEEDGRYAMTIIGCDLVTEVYTHTYFPFLFYRYKHDKTGFFGIGVMEETKQMQFELNYIANVIQKTAYLGCIPKVLVQENSVISSHINNDIGSILKYKGTPPTWAPLMGIPGDLYKLMEIWEEKIYSVVGISMLSAQSKKPAGLDSGKALDTYLDVESDRFAATERAWQDVYKDCAELIIKMGKDIIKEFPEYGVMHFGKNISKKIYFADVDLDEDSYMIQDFPISSLPDNPAEKLAYVQQLAQSQLINQQTTLELLQLPDTSYSLDIQNAQFHACNKIIGMLVEGDLEVKDEEVEFDGMVDINLLFDIAQKSYVYYKYHIVAPESVLYKIQVLIQQCKRAIDIQQQQLQAQQAQMQAMAMQMPINNQQPQMQQGA